MNDRFSANRGSAISRRRLRFEPLEARRLLAAEPVISEFMASNGNTLADGEGNSSDWIEIFNAGDQPADLAGWHLTDRSDNLTRWTFPHVTIGPGEYLVVFASGDGGPDAAGHLHTNFNLDSDGEYLALVRPDGATIASQFGPDGTDYPSQFRDVSYGPMTNVTTIGLIADGAVADVLIPADGSLQASWSEPDFVADGSWTTGPTGVGFATESEGDVLIGTDVQAAMFDRNASAYVRVPFDVADAGVLTQIDELLLVKKYGSSD